MGNYFIPLALSCIAGLSTGVGSFLSFFIKRYTKRQLVFFLGFSAGVMIYISFVDLLASAIHDIGFLYANISFFLGIFLFTFIDKVVPHTYISERVKCENGDTKMINSTFFVIIGIAIHNFPEGFAVLVSSLSDVYRALPLVFAVALHNIPEGIAIAMPVFYLTRSRRKAFYYSLLSGLTEPLGALVGLVFLLPFLSARVIASVLALTAGMMVYISFDELLPLCFGHEKKTRAIIGLVFGMMVMAGSLQLLR